MNKILFVIYRYAAGVERGGELQCRELATRLSKFYNVEVATSCSDEMLVWNNNMTEGDELIDGVLVRRFRVESRDDDAGLSRDTDKLERLKQDLYLGKEGAEEAWVIENGPYCPAMTQWLIEHQNDYRAILFFGYRYYPVLSVLHSGSKRTIAIPTAHNELSLQREFSRAVFDNTAGFLYESPEEKELMTGLFDIEHKPSVATCMGYTVPESVNDELPPGYQDFGDYIIYAGQVTHSKLFIELNHFFIEYKKRKPSDLKLVVIGDISEGYRLRYHKDINYLGYVSDEEKLALMKHAKFLINPSRNESLSIVILEALSVGTPVLVSAHCAVTKGQCIRSQAGLYYENYIEFEKMIDYLLEHGDIRKEMGENGIRFVKENYDWDKVIDNVRSLIEDVANRDGYKP